MYYGGKKKRVYIDIYNAAVREKVLAGNLLINVINHYHPERIVHYFSAHPVRPPYFFPTF